MLLFYVDCQHWPPPLISCLSWSCVWELAKFWLELKGFEGRYSWASLLLPLIFCYLRDSMWGFWKLIYKPLELFITISLLVFYEPELFSCLFDSLGFIDWFLNFTPVGFLSRSLPDSVIVERFMQFSMIAYLSELVNSGVGGNLDCISLNNEYLI